MHLFFTMHLRKSSSLLTGRLHLIDDQKIIDTWISTSGTPGNQALSDQGSRGRGPIPACSLARIPHYFVDLAPLAMPKVRGVEGDFYKISPHFVDAGGEQRGDFGVHRDANVPGSSGCIVIRNHPAWLEWRAIAAKLVEKSLAATTPGCLLLIATAITLRD